MSWEIDYLFSISQPNRNLRKALPSCGQASTLSYNVLDGILPYPINTWDCVPNPRE